MTKRTPPAVAWPVDSLVLIFEGVDLTIHASTTDAVHWLEPIDVREGIFKVFRGDGTPGRLTVTDSHDPQMGVIGLEFGEPSEESRLELAARLNDCFEASGLPPIATAHRLQETIRRAVGRYGITR